MQLWRCVDSHEPVEAMHANALPSNKLTAVDPLDAPEHVRSAMVCCGDHDDEYSGRIVILRESAAANRISNFAPPPLQIQLGYDAGKRNRAGAQTDRDLILDLMYTQVMQLATKPQSVTKSIAPHTVPHRRRSQL